MRLRPVHAFVLLGIVLVMLFVPLPRPGRVMRALQDMAHVPVGAIVAFVAFTLLRGRMRGSRVGVAVVALGVSVVLLALIEIVQPFVGRGRSLADLVAGAFGAAGAMALVLAWGRPALLRTVLGLAGVVLLGIGCVPTGRVVADAWRQKDALPILASFEDDLEMTRWWFSEAEGTRGGAHATDGLWSLRVDLAAGRYPSATLAYPYADWTGYQTLALDLFVDGDEPLDLILKVVDDEHDDRYTDRFHRELELAPGEHVIRVSLDDVRDGPRDRTLDLSRVQSVQLFANGLEAPRTITVDAVRLER